MKRLLSLLVVVFLPLVLCVPLVAGDDVPQPASFEVEIDAPPQAIYEVRLDGRPLRVSPHYYVTQPLYRPATVEVMVRWQDGEEMVTQTLTLHLTPGRHHGYRITIPRTYIPTALC